MIRIRARINLFNVRKTPFFAGYRPAFNFIPETFTSGRIQLLDREEFHPGDSGVVEIWFGVPESLGDDFGVGKRFTFGEGPIPLGDGVIEQILE
jgi:translation elongation factor EF-Tu-like GTPase